MKKKTCLFKKINFRYQFSGQEILFVKQTFIQGLEKKALVQHEYENL